jgi:hypothetical protein
MKQKSCHAIVMISGANPTIAIYNATGSLESFKNKKFFYFEKSSSLLHRCSCKIKSSRIGSWFLRYIFEGNLIALITGWIANYPKC